METMEESPLSFTKKPFLPNIEKRHSTINFNSIHSEPEDVDSIHHKLQKQLQETQVSKKTDFNNDDPELDHDEQIRAPKFQQLPRSRSQNIGEMDDSFISSQSSATPGTSASTSGEDGKSRNVTFVNEDVELTDASESPQYQQKKKPYQPANFAIQRSVSLSDNRHSRDVRSMDVQPVLATLQDYNFEFSNANMNTSTYPLNFISNLEYTTTSPVSHSRGSSTSVSSKQSQNQAQSIQSFSASSSTHKNSNDPSKWKNRTSFCKQYTTNLAPVRTLDEPRTPNYKPCVLRTTLDLPPVTTQTKDDVEMTPVSNFEDLSTITKAHWLPNHHRLSCNGANCDTVFGLVKRRHHCRKCGDIFCSNCISSEYGVKLTYDAQFDVFNGTTAKVCAGCTKDWNAYLEENQYGGLSEMGEDSGNFNFWKDTATATRKLNGVRVDLQDQNVDIDPLDPRPNSKDGVVPADWTWSSF
ncbi:hypothetical protein WICPIJ_004758 [Wickerhamomyces pijperi]|uniref:FYVE-type domain-containing protein n=1 Tax=Wickerhamomyces pijperi TaxID=599730 RepID=A0A9P8Q4X1_WICPI|nr:hypothetical protein WICPIJ_004758 [Wickerhamomyces pijperi]